MSAQTSYSINQPVAYAGLIYAQAPHDIVSFAVETAAGIGFGVAVSRGTDKDKQVVVGGSEYIGVTVRALDQEGVANTGAIKYDQYETAAVMRDGYLWAICPSGCNPGAQVNYNTTTGVLDSGVAGGGETQLDGATWETTAAAGELAVLRVRTATVVGTAGELDQLVSALVTVANSAPPDGVANITIQLQDGLGVDLAAQHLVEIWWSNVAEYGVPAAETSEVISTGTEIQEIVNHAHYKVLSDATGLIEIAITMAVAGDIWVMASIDGKVFTGTATITA